MRKSTRRKLKVYAVDAAMILLAAQVTVVLKADNKAEASTYTTIQAIQDEQAETGSDAETPENDKKYNSASEDELNWNNKDSDILLRIAMAEAEGEGQVSASVSAQSSWAPPYTKISSDLMISSARLRMLFIRRTHSS